MIQRNERHAKVGARFVFRLRETLSISSAHK